MRTAALLTDMDTPLGRAAGNGLEVTESVEALRGDGPDDLMEVTIALAREMLQLVELDDDPEPVIADGSALAAFEAMVKAQDGDLSKGIPKPPTDITSRRPPPAS